jgi:diadenosine tetraphosphate (Ap4A) HIT family hydrolase
VAGDWRRDRVGAAERGENPMVLARLRSGFAVIGDVQFLPGYCVLLASPRVARLEDLSRSQRSVFLDDMGLLGEAMNVACAPLRVNYSIYGNTDAFLHAHVWPRYDWEDEERRRKPPWLYPETHWRDPAFAYDPAEHGSIRAAITEELAQLAS